MVLTYYYFSHLLRRRIELARSDSNTYTILSTHNCCLFLHSTKRCVYTFSSLTRIRNNNNVNQYQMIYFPNITVPDASNGWWSGENSAHTRLRRLFIARNKLFIIPTRYYPQVWLPIRRKSWQCNVFRYYLNDALLYYYLSYLSFRLFFSTTARRHALLER